MTIVTKEDPALWDKDKKEILNESPEGALIFDSENTPEYGTNLEIMCSDKRRIDYMWFKVEVESKTVGYGVASTDVEKAKDEAELQFVLKEEFRGDGNGTKLLSDMEMYLKANGYKELITVIEKSNPNARKVMKWLTNNGYTDIHCSDNINCMMKMLNHPIADELGMSITLTKKL